MKKAIEYIKKHDNIFVFGILLIMVSGFTFNIFLTASDELWNFQHIYKIVNGYTIYRDANVITTPVFHFIASFLFKMFGANFFVFRIYNLLIFAALYMLIYCIFKKLKITKTMSLLYISIIFLLTYKLITGGANYNVLAITFVLLGALCALMFFSKQKVHIWLQVAIIVLIFMTKQNIGFYYIIGTIIYTLLLEKNKWEAILLLLKQGILVLMGILLCTVGFYASGILEGFISYAVLGIGEFAKTNYYGEVLSLVKLLAHLGLLCFLVFYLLNSKKIRKHVNFLQEQKEDIIIIFALAISCFFIIYPIYNDYHQELGSILIYILLINLLHTCLLKDVLLAKQRVITIICVSIMLFANLISIILLSFGIMNIKQASYIYSEPYFGTFFTKNDRLKEKVATITKYIQNNPKNVIVLSDEAALYMVPLKRSNGAMDLPFLGNLGKEEEEGLIHQIQDLENTEILIKQKDEDVFIQESWKVRRYIQENLVKIGEIENYAIYEK